MKKPVRLTALVFFCLITVAAIFTGPGLIGQNAPVTTMGTVGGAVPGQVAVPITVTGFINIGAVSLTFDYEYAGLHYFQGVPNPELDGFAIADHDLGNGKHRVTMGWFGFGVSLPDGDTIMTITFTYISGITALEFYDSGPSCEYADGNFNILNDTPQESYYLNGHVCGSIASPGTITGDASVCAGQSGVPYSVQPLNNAGGYHWTLPAGAHVVTGSNTNAITIDFTASAVSGMITVNGYNVCGPGPASQLAVTVNTLPVADAGTDVTIPYGTGTTLHAASGGSGSYGYHWSPETLLVNPDLQYPQTVNLTVTTLFTLQVTNLATLCSDSDQVVVTITGGPLLANPVVIPQEICNGASAQLFANAGGGSGTYTYLWTCFPPGNPPWNSNQPNPVVSPDTSSIYHLLVNDGFNTAEGLVPLWVDELPSATISGGDTLCGTGNSTILTIDLTGVPPWSFYFSNGVTTWFVGPQYTTPYIYVATEPGIYTVLAVTDLNCFGPVYGSAAVEVFPIPPTPVITVNGQELFSSACCGNQWYMEGLPIPGATGPVYEPAASAHYFDIVTVNGCSSDTSNVIHFFMTHAQTGRDEQFKLEPNPATDYFRVLSNGPELSSAEFRIFSVTGKQAPVRLFQAGSARNQPVIDVRDLSPGVWLLYIVTGTKTSVVKLIVQ